MDSGLVSPSASSLARRDRKKARGSFRRVLRRDSRAGLFLRSGLSATASRNRLTASIACFSRSSALDRCFSSRELDDLSWVLAWSSLPLAERRSAFAFACTVKIPALPPTAASMTDVASAATAGFRLHQSHARSAGPTRRAAIGRESSQDRRSSANAWADAYRRRGSFARHFRQIVSRSRGTFGLRTRGDSGGRSFTACRVSARLSPPNGALPVSSAYRMAPKP